MKNRAVHILIGLAVVSFLMVVAIQALSTPKQWMVALHSRRSVSVQMTWISPDGATSCMVYRAHLCPQPTCKLPSCTISPDGGPDGGPIVVGACSSCGAGSSVFQLDAGLCTCFNDAGAQTCINGAITPGMEADAGCKLPLCCFPYPGTLAPAGKRDGIIVGVCYHPGPDGALNTDAAQATYIENWYAWDTVCH